MIEVAAEVAEAHAGSANDVSAGTLLRQAREAAGLHVAALAVSLKVPVRKLEALEADRFDEMPDSVFVRGLAASVCRTLKIDPQPVLDRLPQSTAPRLIPDTDGLNAPFRAPSDGAPPGWFDRLRQPVSLAVLALLLGAIVLILLPSTQKEAPPAAAAAQPAPTVEQTPTQPLVLPAALAASDMAPQVAPQALPSASSSAAVSPAVNPASAQSAAALTAVPATAAPASKSSASVTASDASAATVAEANAAPGLLMIRAKGETWVEVTDAKGVTALRKLLAAGESASASGALPLHVTIGRAHLTDVLVRGKPFDMRPVSRDDVARFEVK